MTIDRITYRKVFAIGPYMTETPGFEASIEPNEDPIEALKRLKEIATKFFNESNPHVGESVTYFTPVMQPEPIIPDAKADAEYAELIKKLNKFKSKEEALEYLSTTNWKHTIEAKQFINTKFTSNGKVNEK